MMNNTHVLCDEDGDPIFSGSAGEMHQAEIEMRAAGFDVCVRLARDLWNWDSMTWRKNV
jgi:hypothetical protein